MKGITQKSIHSQNIQKIKNVVLFTVMCACFFSYIRTYMHKALKKPQTKALQPKVL